MQQNMKAGVMPAFFIIRAEAVMENTPSLF
jgi:hypothetical protein